MNRVYTVFSVLILLLVSCATLFAQATGDYRTIATGDWNSAAIWQRYNGSSWVSAPSAPTGTGVITVQSADSVFINVAVSITGTLKNQGKLGGTGSLTVANGGTYQHDEPNGSIPVCTWSTGSTCLVTGYTSGSKPSNSNQNFYNFIWRCAGQTANVDLGMGGNTIGGDFTVDTTGASRVYLTSPASYVFGNPITINGNVLVRGGQFSSNGSSSADTIEVITQGNIVVTGGNFGVSRGSGPEVTWKLYGNFTVTNAVLQNSGGTRVNKLAFVGNGIHNITLTNVTYGSGTSYFTMEVQTGSTANFGTSVVGSSNSGSFVVLAGGTLATGNVDGVNGTIQCTGASNGGGNAFSTDANYTFNGSAVQITGTMMPATVADLTINNPTRVRLTQATTINDTLHLRAGQFDIGGATFTLGPNGRVSNEGGTIVSVEPQGSTIPETFFVDQNYPNPFNPSTTIRFGIPSQSYVTVRVLNLLGQEVAAPFAGNLNAGVHTLNFNASRLGSGMYFCRIQANSAVDVKRMILMK